MTPSTLETTVRNYVEERYHCLKVTQRAWDGEVIRSIVDRETETLTSILRERMSDDDEPSEDDLYLASMTKSQREIESSIRKLKDPATREKSQHSPRKQAIISALIEDAQIDLEALRTLNDFLDEEKLASVTEAIVARMQARTEQLNSRE